MIAAAPQLVSEEITINIHHNAFIIQCSFNAKEMISTLNANDMDCTYM